MQQFVKSKNVVMYNGRSGAVAFDRISLRALRLDQEARNLLESFEEPSNAPNEAESLAVFKLFLHSGLILNADSTSVLKHEETPQLLVTSFRIVLTEACNYRCTYCFEGNLLDNPRTMSEQRLSEVIDKIARQVPIGHRISIHWFGGEPLLRFSLIKFGIERFEKLEREGKIRGADHSLTTNGGLVTSEIAEFLKLHNVQSLVSFDGLQKVNDAARIDKVGNGTFERAAAGYSKLRNKGANVGIIVTPNLSNIDEFSRHVQNLIERFEPVTVHINTPQPGPNGWDVNGAVLAKQLLVLSDYCLSRNISLVSPDQKIRRALALSEWQRLDCVNSAGESAVSIGPNGHLGYCIVSWSDQDHASASSEWEVQEAGNWKLTDHRTDACRMCPAENVCGGPCPLEASFDELNKERCAFYLTYLSEVLTQ